MELRDAMFACAEAIGAIPKYAGLIPEMICVRPCLSGDGKFAAFVNSHKALELDHMVAYADDPVAAVNKLRRFHEK